MIFMLMGESGSGKDTVAKRLLQETALSPIVLYTTRPKRVGEVDGREYHFVSDEALEQMKDFVAESRTYHTVHGDWTYATVLKDLDEQKDYLMIGTPESFCSIRRLYPDIIPILLTVDTNLRLHRAILREQAKIDWSKEEETYPDYEELIRRYLADKKDFENLDFIGNLKRIENKDLSKCVATIVSYMEQCHTKNTSF